MVFEEHVSLPLPRTHIILFPFTIPHVGKVYSLDFAYHVATIVRESPSRGKHVVMSIVANVRRKRPMRRTMGMASRWGSYWKDSFADLSAFSFLLSLTLLCCLGSASCHKTSFWALRLFLRASTLLRACLSLRKRQTRHSFPTVSVVNFTSNQPFAHP